MGIHTSLARMDALNTLMETQSRMAKFKIRDQLRKVREAKFNKQQEIERARDYIDFALFVELISQEEARQYHQGLRQDSASVCAPIIDLPVSS